jgi:hypothetical protein
MIATRGADTARPASFRSLSPAIAPGSSHSGDVIMADYHSPTVVQPTIPIADMTPLERLLLTRIFEAEPDGDGLYLSAEIGPTEAFAVAVEDLRTAFNQSAGTPSTASDYFAERMADIGDGDTYIEVDLARTFPRTNQGPARAHPSGYRPAVGDARPHHRRFGLHLHADAPVRIRRGGADHGRRHQEQIDK